MAGELNGTSVLVAKETGTPGTYSAIGGQLSHSMTLNNGLIDITNKSSASVRELMASEGLQSLDVSMEIVFNSETYFDELKTMAGDKSAANFEIDRGTDVVQAAFQVASWAESSPDNDKLTASVTLQSTGAITWA